MKKFLNYIAIPVCFLMAVTSMGYAQTKKQTGPLEKCLILSDIHFDPLYGSKSDTALTNKLKNSPVSKWPKYFEASKPATILDASLLNHDANYAVLKSALINMKRQLPHPAFIVIAGDFIWHNATPADSVMKRKVIQFIAYLFKNAYPNTPIIPAMGNNDTYGADYDLQNPEFWKDFADAWSPNLPQQSATELKAQGYYSWKHHGLKLMVINSAPFNLNSPYPEQAAAELKWIEDGLAQTANKNTWLLSHIPPGTNGYNAKFMWDANYSHQFTTSVVNHAAKVKFGIASHTHFNDYKVFYKGDEKPVPVAYMRIVPSVCSNHGNNPSFEVATFNSVTGKVLNETNHYLNLAAVPVGNNNTGIYWGDRLQTTTLLSGPINARNLSRLTDRIKNDTTGKTLANYIRFYTVSTHIDSAYRVNRANYMNYLQADSLKVK